MEERQAIASTFSYWLMASYLYYELGVGSPWPDRMFDRMSDYLLLNWDKLEHMHKHLVTEECLRCQTGFGIDYPNIVKSCAIDWRNECDSVREIIKREI